MTYVKLRVDAYILVLASVHLANLVARLIYPFSFVFLAVERLSDALKPTIRHEQHEVRSGEFLLLAAVDYQFQGIQLICDNLDAHIGNIAIRPGPICRGRVEPT